MADVFLYDGFLEAMTFGASAEGVLASPDIVRLFGAGCDGVVGSSAVVVWSPSCLFQASAGSVAFRRNPRRPSRALTMLQTEAETAGGVRYGYEPAGAEKALTLVWPAMAMNELAALRTFFATVGGMALPFAYTDPAGTTWTVRFAEPEIRSTEISKDSYAVTVRLLEAA